MAFGMKQWSALVAVLLTAVVWMAVPPRSLEELPLGWSARRTQPSAAEQHRNRLFEATWRANARLQTHRWADSLRPLVLEHGTRGVLLGLTAPDRPRDEVELLREYLHEEIPPGTAGQAAVGVFFLPAGASGYPGLVTRRLEGYYFGRAEDSTPYCFAARSQSLASADCAAAAT